MIALNVPLVTWCVIAIAMVTLVIVRACQKTYNAFHRHSHLFEIGSEREEFFIPGDRPMNDKYIYDDDD
ncbi:MAG: hypothetical protein K2G00_07265 [Duncaniella sp.]|nr:hypothetical protein [Bacteroides sp.]MDE5827392.1 hypothetical protein [Duncaniella sp.]MDE6062532.1 hypothetical protein [Duncaniella sp.]MDE6823813.1 hypothetical protein [Duncaniella sp.]MDE7475714.1 hypothetical protein [Duncaniella sp.]